LSTIDAIEEAVTATMRGMVSGTGSALPMLALVRNDMNLGTVLGPPMSSDPDMRNKQLAALMTFVSMFGTTEMVYAADFWHKAYTPEELQNETFVRPNENPASSPRVIVMRFPEMFSTAYPYSVEDDGTVVWDEPKVTPSVPTVIRGLVYALGEEPMSVEQRLLTVHWLHEKWDALPFLTPEALT